MYTIKEISEKLKISANSIRFYEKKKLITPLRGENGYRVFTAKDLSKLQMIVLYRSMGFSIEAILEIMNSNVENTILEQFSSQYNILNDHIHAMISIRETMGECIEKMLNTSGIDETMIESMEMTANIIAASNNWKDSWNFDVWAENYDEDIRIKDNGLNFYASYDEVLERTSEKIIPGKVVEVGIGTGNLARRIIENNCDEIDYIGVEQSINMLKQAKKKCPEAKLRIGNFLKLPLSDNIADTIVTSYAFHHCNEDEKALAIAEMNRVLKKNGRIVIADLMFANDNSRNKFELTCTEREREDLKDEYFANVDKVEEIFSSYGFRCKSEQIDKLIWIIIADRLQHNKRM